MKKMIAASVALALSSVALVACGEKPAAPEENLDGKPGVEVSNGRLVLPAVAGNPAAVYFDVVNTGNSFAALRTADVAGAKETAMHETFTDNGTTRMETMTPVNLAKGQPVKFEPGGKHVMAMGFTPAPKAGDTVDVTLTFAGGDKTTFAAKVETPGGSN